MREDQLENAICAVFRGTNLTKLTVPILEKFTCEYSKCPFLHGTILESAKIVAVRGMFSHKKTVVLTHYMTTMSGSIDMRYRPTVRELSIKAFMNSILKTLLITKKNRLRPTRYFGSEGQCGEISIRSTGIFHPIWGFDPIIRTYDDAECYLVYFDQIYNSIAIKIKDSFLQE